MPRLGTTVGSWRVEAFLGRGGMAEVWRVRHSSLASACALKILQVARADVRERLLREGRIQASLGHPNVVRVLDVLEVGGLPALLMEYVEGQSLAERIEAGPLSPAELDTIFRGLLDGLEAAHAAGAVHRDLKPSNVLLAREGERIVPRITDFGLAKLVSDSMPSGGTQTGMGAGTPAYMAPEQWRDAKRVDSRADLFSLGCMLFEMVTGSRAFAGDDVPTILAAVIAGRHGAIPAGVEPPVAAAIRACLAVERSERPADVAALRAIYLGDSRPPERIAAHTFVPAEGPTVPAKEAVSTLAPTSAPAWPARLRTVLAAVAVAGVAGASCLVCGLGAWGWMHGGSVEREEVVTAPPVTPSEASEAPVVHIGDPSLATALGQTPDTLVPAVARGKVGPPDAPPVELPDLISFTGIRFRRAPAGVFTMGNTVAGAWADSDEVAHEVRLSRPFWIGETEVTQAQYEAVMGHNPSTFLGHSERPVEGVSWYDALAFCNALSARERLAPAYQVEGRKVVWARSAPGYRLPTEAEWEYAARAGGSGAYVNIATADTMCWHQFNSDATTHPVRQLAANPWGLFDTLGNVAEWVWDESAPYAGPATDPAGPSAAEPWTRGLRGNAFTAGPPACRATDRDHGSPTLQNSGVGFRLARSATD